MQALAVIMCISFTVTSSQIDSRKKISVIDIDQVTRLHSFRPRLATVLFLISY